MKPRIGATACVRLGRNGNKIILVDLIRQFVNYTCIVTTHIAIKFRIIRVIKCNKDKHFFGSEIYCIRLINIT